MPNFGTLQRCSGALNRQGRPAHGVYLSHEVRGEITVQTPGIGLQSEFEHAII